MPRNVKSFARLVHQIAARHRWVAKSYLTVFRLAKWAPDAMWKKRVINSLQSVSWPELELRAAKTHLTPAIAVMLAPHVCEFDFAAHVCRRMDYEPEIASWLESRTYDVVLDIGANIGIHTLLFARMWPSSRIYSFEPARTAYSRLTENLTINGCANVRAFNCAVGAESGIVSFYEPAGHLTNGSLDGSFARIFNSQVAESKVLSIRSSDLERLIPQGSRVLIKIDVEGAESLVIRSMLGLLQRFQPDLIVEVLPGTDDELNRIPELRGYRLFHLQSKGPVARERFVAGEGRDYALVPIAHMSHHAQNDRETVHQS